MAVFMANAGKHLCLVHARRFHCHNSARMFMLSPVVLLPFSSVFDPELKKAQPSQMQRVLVLPADQLQGCCEVSPHVKKVQAPESEHAQNRTLA